MIVVSRHCFQTDSITSLTHILIRRNGWSATPDYVEQSQDPAQILHRHKLAIQSHQEPRTVLPGGDLPGINFAKI